MKLKSLSYFLIALVVLGSFAPFVTAQFTNSASEGFTGANYGSITNTYQSSRPTFDNFYGGAASTYWPILNNLQEDQCDAVNSDFIIGIPPGGCSPMVVRSDLLAEQNVPVFCQLSAIRVNPLIDVSTIKSISFKGDYPDEVAGISFHPARAAVKSYRTLLGDPIEENIGYVVIVLKQQPDERNLEEYVSGMLTATVRYDAQGSFGTGAAEYYLEDMTDDEWDIKAPYSSFWAGKGYLRVINVDEDEATIQVLSDKEDVYRTVTLKEGETSNRIYTPGQYCTAAMRLKLNKIDNSEDMAKIDIDGDIFWVRKGSKLLGGKCVVRDLNVFPSGSGSVEISCSGNSRFTLVLGDSGVVLNNGSKENVDVGIGGSINVGKEKIYLGYYGKSEAFENKNTNPNGEFAILFEDSLTEDDVSDITGIFDVVSFNKTEDMNISLNRLSKFKGKYEFVEENKTGEGIAKGVKVVSVGFDTSVGGYGEATHIPEYLEKAEGTVSNLIELFPSEKKENDEYFGEEALYKQILLAQDAKDENMQIELIKKFLDTYPGSDSVEYMRNMKLNIDRFDQAGSSASVIVNNEDYNIRADGFASGSAASDSVTIRIGDGTTHPIKRGITYDILHNFAELNETNKVLPRLTVVDIEGTSAEFTYYWNNSDGKTSHERGVINEGSSASLGDRQFSVVKTEIREVAYVSLIPEVRNTKTEANFTFNIGIEKRAIEISPEKAQKKVDALNKSIAEWESKIDKLGKLVKGMKAACLATSAVLTLKSFIAGFSGGAAIARGDVMDKYETICREEHSEMSQSECYALLSPDIERDVEAYGNAITGVNDAVKRCTSSSEGVKSGFFDSKVVNTVAYIKDLKDCETAVGSDWLMDVGGTNINKANLTDASDYQAVLTYEGACSSAEKINIKNANGDSTKIRALDLSVPCQIAYGDLGDVLGDNVDRIKASKVASSIGVLEGEVQSSKTKTQSMSATKVVGVKKVGPYDLSKGNYYAVIQEDNDFYVYVLEKQKEFGNFKVVNVSKGGKDIGNVSKYQNRFKFSEAVASDSCSNPITKLFVRYYEEANTQGFAAIVPIDKVNGWYAYIESSAYTGSGMVPNYFEICNVGPDGLMVEGSKGGERICQGFQSSSPNKKYISCGDFDASSLYSKAERLISEANRNGNGVYLGGQLVPKTSPLGPTSTGVECTDFMSVSDCNLMFNVCDPVICPTSRCDLGGKFPVSDVIASGIIGSVALCLPNFGTPANGGVLIPVCLSGIHAGLDAYVSILRSHRDCLQENIDTGRYTGICDEITAVYTCEFFWGQFAPILDTLLVRFVEGLYGGFQTKGGAEYLTVQKSFDNLDSSIDYFANTYMSNSVRAFNLRSTEEIGGTVCKGFVGSSVPTSADMLDSLLEPESPSQFYAYFSEDLFSDATVPSTSHYKVYYHIYAGNDFGAQYRVYLKSPPESSYYSSRQTLLVDSGYVAKGIAADESLDFTAPTGYKELCVSVNGQDECGFGSVTSDFGLNYASQEYINDQADDRQIDSTEDCVTTSTSAWGMASLNVQDGVEASLGGDDISTTGIVRVCASSNPEKGVVGGNDVYCDSSIRVNNSKCAYGYVCEAPEDETSGIAVCKSSTGNQVSQGNWVDVGTCDGGNMICWLDVSSVKENLGQYMAVNNLTVSQLVRESEDLKELNEQYKDVSEKLNVLKGAYEKLQVPGTVLLNDEYKLTAEVEKIIVGLDQISGVESAYEGQGSNAAKAQALSIKAAVYWLIVEDLISKNVDVVGSGGVVDTEGDAPVVADVKTTEANIGDAVLNDEAGVTEVEIIVYTVGQTGATDLYFRYNVDIWEWSPDKENWMKVPTVKVSGGVYDGRPPASANVQLIINLKDKDLEAGKTVLKDGSKRFS